MMQRVTEAKAFYDAVIRIIENVAEAKLSQLTSPYRDCPSPLHF